MARLWTDPNNPTFMKWLQPVGLCLEWKDPEPSKRKVEFFFGVLKSLLSSWFRAAWKAWREFPHLAHFLWLPAAWLRRTFCGLWCVPCLGVIIDAARRAGTWQCKAGHPARFTRVLFPDWMLGWWYLVWFISYWKRCEAGLCRTSGFSQSGLCSHVWQAAGARLLVLKEKFISGKDFFFFSTSVTWETYQLLVANTMLDTF